MILDDSMSQFHPIIYSLADGGALGKTVEANDADEACRKAAAGIFDLSLPEVDRLFEQHQLEVIAVIQGDPQCCEARHVHLVTSNALCVGRVAAERA